MIEVTENPIDPLGICERLSRKGAGSVVVHVGIVKPVADGRPTRGIRFAPKGDLQGEIETIETKLRKHWDITDALLIRRIGELAVGDIILAAAISAPSREAAFGACREAVESFKKLECMQKEELFEDTADGQT